MVTISIIGLDPYLVRQISNELSPKLAEIYEMSSDDIWYYAPECLYIHNGVEQNTWSILVRVHAPKKVEVMEKEAKDIIHYFIQDACVHMRVVFEYYSLDHKYDFIDDSHPRYMTEENSVMIEEDAEEMGEDVEPYLGNIFEGFEDKIKEKK